MRQTQVSFRIVKFKRTAVAVAVGAMFSVAPSLSQAAAFTTVADATWASAGGKTQANIANAKSGDTVAIGAGFTLTITNDGTADDNSADKNTFAPGAITNTAGTGKLTIVTGSANGLTVNTAGVSVGSNISITNTGQNGQTVTVTSSAAVSAGGTYTLGQSSSTAAVIHTVNADFTSTGAASIVGGAAGGGTSTLVLSGTTNALTAGATLTDNSGTATLKVYAGTADQTVSGTINGNAAGKGTLTVVDQTADTAANTATFSGAIGGTASLANINVGSSTESGNAIFSSAVSATNITITGGNHANETGKATFNGNVTATAISLDDNTGVTTMTVSGTSAQTIAGTINAATAGEGTLAVASSGGATFSSAIGGTAKLGTVSVSSGTATFNSTVAATNIAVSGGTATFKGNLTGAVALSGGTTVLSGNIGTTGAITMSNTATLDLGANTGSTGSTTFDTGSGGATIKTTLASASTAGKLTLTGNATVNSSAKLNITVGSYTVTNGQQFTIIDGAGGAGVSTLTASNITDDSAILSFTQVTNTQDLVIQAVRSSGGYSAAAGIAATDSSNAASTALNSLAGTSSGSVTTLINYLDGLSSSALATEAKKLAPVASAAVTQAAMGATTGAINVASQRLASLRGDTQLASGETGVSAGDGMKDQAFWMKGFGAYAKQNMQTTFDGYKSRMSGLAFGADADVGNGIRAGLAFSAAGTQVNVRDARSGDTTNVASYQLTGYATKEYGDYYTDGLVSYSQHKTHTARAVPQGLVAKGNFDSDQWAAKLGGGYRMKMAAGTFIPMASLTVSSLKRDAYTETDGGGANLTYASKRVGSTKSGLGASFVGAADTWTPEAHLIWNHEFGNRRVDTTSNFAGGNSFETTGMEIKRDSLNLGGGVTYKPSKLSSVNFGYDAEGRSGFISHTLQVTGRWMF